MPDTPDNPSPAETTPTIPGSNTPPPPPPGTPPPHPQGTPVDQPPSHDPYAAFRQRPAPAPSAQQVAAQRAAAEQAGKAWEARAMEFQPMERPEHFFSALEDLLKRPGRVVYELGEGRFGKLLVSLTGLIAISLLIYGLVVATLSGGWQFFYAPAKILTGALIAYIITLPSLYIFMCLDGAEVKFRGVAGLFLAVLALMSVLLIGFAPVAWIFSQSTNSVALMTLLHLFFFFVSLLFGLRVLFKALPRLNSSGSLQVGVWAIIFMAVCLQMMTALRPIIGSSPYVLTAEKKFFLQHWFEVNTRELDPSSMRD